MKLSYYPETDSLYLELNSNAGNDSHEVGDGVVVDIDERGNPVGLDIDRASVRLDLQRLQTTGLPGLIIEIG